MSWFIRCSLGANSVHNFSHLSSLVISSSDLGPNDNDELIRSLWGWLGLSLKDNGYQNRLLFKHSVEMALYLSQTTPETMLGVGVWTVMAKFVHNSIKLSLAALSSSLYKVSYGRAWDLKSRKSSSQWQTPQRSWKRLMPKYLPAACVTHVTSQNYTLVQRRC